MSVSRKLDVEIGDLEMLLFAKAEDLAQTFNTTSPLCLNEKKLTELDLHPYVFLKDGRRRERVRLTSCLRTSGYSLE